MMRPSLLAMPAVLALVAACGGADEPSTGSSTGGAPTTSPGSSGGSTSSGGSSSGTASSSGGTDGGASSGTTTTPPKTVRFIAVGDTGTGSPDQTKVGNTIGNVCKTRGCDFVQLLGDNLYGHGGAGTDFPKGQHEVDRTKYSKKWKMPAAYYKRTVQHVDFFALDTNMQMFGQDSAQKKDMEAWIKASTATWKITLGHHPYKSNGPHGNAGKYDGTFFPPVNGNGVKSFLEDVVCGTTDLYLSGHDHSRQWMNESCKGTELAVSGAGAKATELGGNNPTLFQSLELGFLYIVIQDKTLTAEFIDDSGVVEFTHVIKK